MQLLPRDDCLAMIASIRLLHPQARRAEAAASREEYNPS
jgi:hypothetical protein